MMVPENKIVEVKHDSRPAITKLSLLSRRLNVAVIPIKLGASSCTATAPPPFQKVAPLDTSSSARLGWILGFGFGKCPLSEAFYPCTVVVGLGCSYGEQSHSLCIGRNQHHEMKLIY